MKRLTKLAVKDTNTAFKALAYVVVTVACLGLIGPSLFSAESDIAVALGVVVVGAWLLITVFLITLNLKGKQK